MDDASALYIGLISGTSADSIDAALVSFNGEAAKLQSSHAEPWPAELRTQMLALAQGEATFDLDTFGQMDVAIGNCFADAALHLLERSGTDAASVRAIGSHGQTLRHRPGGTHPFTLQLGDPSVIAERCGIDVVADFRRADLAAGGQGAPLVPAFHATLLAQPGHTRVVLNLGGIANITILRADGHVLGFDTGPANGLLDAWCLRQLGEPFDRDGAFASRGSVDHALLDTLLDDSYFALMPPKSTGREHFHLNWLAGHAAVNALQPADVQATLLELTAQSVSLAIALHAPDANEILVCGGGVHNTALLRRLQELLKPRTVVNTDRYGVDPDFLEAVAFAWLARQRVLGRPGNLPAVTGAHGPRVLGGLYSGPELDTSSARIRSGDN